MHLLNQIAKVKAPEHLYAKIEQKMCRQKKEVFSSGVSIILGIAAMLLVILNISIATRYEQLPEKSHSLIQMMNLVQDDSIYK